ncbi:helix-turn-helix transcriptional regulator [Flavobacterium sp. Root186]|uniref:helix-turn-helix transcriptional regulator n=1 Tax=Flavobacterium sp. Root186 TaxID=1736485 RepID=UPI0006FA0839|nr:helix-turn-helix transcriptional regulator [Flavobacterium sp. Root186]KRB57468.1 AraC family transcriptional regulator [Flavobacterium sp. Root186]
MEYKETKPCTELEPFIHSFWEMKGSEQDKQWERIFPDGCTGLVLNLGGNCITDNGLVSMESEKTYAVGAMTSFKDSFIDNNTHLFGVCLKPAAFTNFYKYLPQSELIDNTVEFDKTYSFNIDKILKNPIPYLNQFYSDRIIKKDNGLKLVIEDIHNSNGQLPVYELAKKNYTTVRQLERNFKTHIGISPKEYSNIVRFQNTLNVIKNADHNRNLFDISFECGFYDHSHLTNNIKKYSGLTPTEL